jgi:hypothetical protein
VIFRPSSTPAAYKEFAGASTAAFAASKIGPASRAGADTLSKPQNLFLVHEHGTSHLYFTPPHTKIVTPLPL